MEYFCPLCEDQPGGCIFCARKRRQQANEWTSSNSTGVAPVSDYVTEEVFGRDQAEFEDKVAAGEIKLIAVSERHRLVMELPAPSRSALAQEPRPLKCESHLWAFDTGNFHRRHCTRPGCQARQRFEWQPESLTQQGQWVDDVQPVVSGEPKRPKARKRTAKRATK